MAPAPAGGFVAVMTEPSPGTAPDSPDVYARRFVPAARAPQVDRVYVRGTDWSADFLSYLESSGIGSSQFGYTAGGTPDPLPLPWGNLNQVSISFNGDVAVGPDDLHVTGVERASYPVAGFEYDRARHVATWRFEGRLPADRLALTLDAPGLRHAFALNVVPGDANRDGRTNALDVATVRLHLGTRAHRPGDIGGMDYVRTVDLNGDGRIDALDVAPAKRDLNRSLPRATALLP